MSLSSNSVYFSVFMYNPYMLTRPYRHLTSVAFMELHHIMCVSLDIILIVRFGNQAHACRVDTPTNRRNEFATLQQKFFWLFDELSDNNASDNGSSLSASV